MLNALKRLSIVDRMRNVLRSDVDRTLKPLRKEIRRLSKEVAQLDASLRETTIRAAQADRQSAQVKWTLTLDAAQREALANLDAVLDYARIGAHVERAVAAATLHEHPFPHAVVDRVLPDDIYALLLDSIPPIAFFTDNDRVKQDLPIPMTFGPKLHVRVWGFVDEVIARKAIQPAVMRKFHAALQQYYDVIFGPAFRDAANRLPQLPSGGRLMLRRPGYHLGAHRDPKRSLLTCLLYLARPGDDESHGTRLYAVEDDSEADYKQTYYPERAGHRCELVKVVPFRPNSMLVFLNSHGAHGAGIPDTAPPATERCSYQFYVAPENGALATLIKSLPPERRDKWKNRNRVAWDASADANAQD